jgi:RNA polymerase sigma-70 factor (ECF subfamily)
MNWHLYRREAGALQEVRGSMETEATARAIEALIQQYSRLVFHVIYSMTGHWEESQDLTQDTFLQAFRGIEAARAKAGAQFQAKPWLLKIAVNNVHMAQRRQRGLRFIPFADLQPKYEGFERTTDESSAYEEVQEAGDLETMIAERDVVSRCLQRLPGTLRAPLLLSIVAGFSSKEIAQMLGVKEATVRQRLTRARQTFQRLYAQASGEHVRIGGSALRAQKHLSRSRDHVLHRPAALVPAVL